LTTVARPDQGTPGLGARRPCSHAHLLESPPAEAFERLTRLATLATGAPIALVALVDLDRQIAGSCGISGDFPAAPRQLPLSQSYCQFVLRARAPVLVEDTLTHPLTSARASSSAVPFLRAYAGAPIFAADGEVVGAFCVLDEKPRAWSASEIELLEGFAAAASTEVALRAAIADRESAEVATANSEARLVDARIAAEATLREGETRLRLALDVAGMGVWERDIATGRVTGAVPVGGPSSSVDALPFTTYDGFLAAVHPEDRERVRRSHADAFERGIDSTVDYRIGDGKGGWRFRQATARLLHDANGNPERIVGVTRDVTERVALEETLRQAQKMEAVGQLAGGIAHDFNNLLTVITGGVQFARDAAPAGSAVHDELAAVQDAAERATQLTRQLLAFSRAQVLEPEVLDPNRVIERVEPMLRRLIGEDIQIITRAGTGIGSVRADPGQLDQVLINLAVNARDAMPQGGRLLIETTSLDVSVADARRRGGTVAPGRYVRLVVSDTGVGMDRATLAHLFEPFFTTKGPGKGTGLGLATVHGIVTQSGGFVTVTSEPGRGTAFEVALPEVPESAAPEVAASAQATQREPARATVLLVEDDPHVRRLAGRVLRRAGYTLFEAESGPDALRRAAVEAASVDVVVTDMVMPEMSGRTFAEQYATHNPRVKVLFISGYTDDEIVRRRLLTPGMAFLGKPFTPEQFCQAVERVLAADGREAP
jgi:signal transduction histidine kinase/CheY-like chemotaxis protein